MSTELNDTIFLSTSVTLVVVQVSLQIELIEVKKVILKILSVFSTQKVNR